MKDFYKYINDEWLKNITISDDNFKISTFDIINKKNDDKIKDIILNNTFLNKFYQSMINNKSKISNINNIIELIDNIKNLNQLMSILSFFHSINCNIFWDIYVSENFFNSNEQIINLTQGNVCLYDISLYNNDDYNNTLENYKNYMYSMFEILYEKDDTMIKICDKILEFEKKLANIMLNKKDIRNFKDNIYEITLDDFNKEYNKGINLNIYIKSMINLLDNNIDKKHFNKLLIENNLKNNDKNYFKKLDNLLINTDINILKLYIKWVFIDKYLIMIDTNAEKLHFDFYYNKIKGQKKPKSIEKKTIKLCKSYFGDLIGYEFGKKYYNKEIDKYINKMIDNIIDSCNNNINKITWMSIETKKNALKKLKYMKRKVGYNLISKKYNINLSDNLFNNLIKIEYFLTIDNFNKLKNNLNEWNMFSFEVNASYDLNKNEITIPCGILQKDIIDYKIINNKYIFNDYYNYASIGSIIGHEIIHGFDDNGRLFDMNGNLKDWWNNQDKLYYNNLIKKIIKMYNKEGVDGNLTISENIADIGGLQLSLHALYNLYGDITNDNLKIFFSSYTKMWKTKLTNEYINMVKITDYHSLPWVRVNTTLKNINEFYKVYDIQNGYNENDRFNLFN